MTTDEIHLASSPYTLVEPPTSTGRIFLGRAFAHYCALHWGYSGEELADAFRGEGSQSTVANVRLGARIVGETLARGTIRSWSRPIGGGDPAELRAGVWELDTFDRRFAISGIDPRQPFDDAAAPTCWIFVDVEGWNHFVEASLPDYLPVPRRRSFRPTSARPEEIQAPDADREYSGDAPIHPDRLIRLDEVKHLTGLSRSSIYRRMEQGRFPSSVPMSGNVAVWRERQVAEWLANPL